MALADITLADGLAVPVNHTFTYIDTTNGRVRRANLAVSPEVPEYMTIGHQENTRNGIKMDSHLMRFDLTALDADGITPLPFNGRLAFDMARSIYSDDRADILAGLIRNFATNANIRALLRRSVF